VRRRKTKLNWVDIVSVKARSQNVGVKKEIIEKGARRNVESRYLAKAKETGREGI